MENFEEMLENSLKAITPGTVIEGEVLSVTNDEIFVNIGYKADGIVSKTDFSYDENKDITSEYKPGDTIKVYVVSLNDGRGNVVLSTKKLEEEKLKNEFESAISNNATITVKITEILEKGVRANYLGTRIFIPASQLVNKDVNYYQGKTIDIKIIENKDRRVIGSERRVNSEERQKQASATMQNIKVGDIVKGTVKRINEYGAFVDIGGVEGLLHVSQMTWKRNVDPKDIVKEGQVLDVEIIELDKEKGRIALKSKKDEENPWNEVGTSVVVGAVLDVKVLRLVPFGAFVEIKEGLEGFIHISQISTDIIKTPNEVLELGQTVTAKVVVIDTEKKRIELSIKALSQPVEQKDEQEAETVEEEKIEE